MNDTNAVRYRSDFFKFPLFTNIHYNYFLYTELNCLNSFYFVLTIKTKFN